MSTPAPAPARSKPVEVSAQVVRGFAMGAADVVPGVSGGTVALVLGIYERLLHNIRTGASVIGQLLRRDLRAARRDFVAMEWWWVASLLGGIFLAVATMASLIERLLADHPETMAGLFVGLIVGSVIISWRLVKRVDAEGIVIMLVAAAAFFLLLGLRADTESTTAELVTKPFWAFFLAGAIAICAMILPGISGSFILVILGMYGEVLGAVNDRNLLMVLVFVLGCIAGLAAFSTVLNWSLEHHHDRVLASMIGLMLGSLRVLWPWPSGVSSTRLEAPSDPVALPIIAGAIGLVVVLSVELVGLRIAKRRAAHATR